MALIEEKKFQLDIGELTISSGRESEAQRLIEYVQQISRETDYLRFSPGEFDMSVDEEKQFLRNYNESENKIFVVARLDGEGVGTLNFESPQIKRYSHRGETGISVVRKYWGHGIGSCLLEVMLDWTKDNNYKKIGLRVDASNKRAIELYKKYGFKIEGTLKRHRLMEDGEYRDEYYMGLIL